MMETKKSKLEILRCNNGFFIENKSGRFVFKDGGDVLAQMGKELEKMEPGEKMLIEYAKDGEKDKDNIGV